VKNALRAIHECVGDSTGDSYQTGEYHMSKTEERRATTFGYAEGSDKYEKPKTEE
jgi:hypothetical protein